MKVLILNFRKPPSFYLILRRDLPGLLPLNLLGEAAAVTTVTGAALIASCFFFLETCIPIPTIITPIIPKNGKQKPGITPNGIGKKTNGVIIIITKPVHFDQPGNVCQCLTNIPTRTQKQMKSVNQITHQSMNMSKK